MSTENGRAMQTPPGAFTRFRKEWIEPILIAFVLAAIIRSFIVQPFKIPSGSMEDTLLVGDQLMALKFSYGIKLPFADSYLAWFRDPRPGEVIVFKYPENPSQDFIKRCIAVGGQTVEIRDKQIYVDGELQLYPDTIKFIDQHILPSYISERDTFGPVTVPAGHMFMMGDNRDNSNDSRFWGFVPYDNIKGRAAIVWWSWNHDKPLYDLAHHVRWGRIFQPIR